MFSSLVSGKIRYSSRLLTRDGAVLLVLLVAVGRTVIDRGEAPPDRGALALFVFVTLALAVVCRLTAGT